MLSGVWSLVRAGMAEKDVLNLHLPTFYKYVELDRQYTKNQRLRYTVDTSAAIGGALSKDGLKKYFKAIDGEYVSG